MVKMKMKDKKGFLRIVEAFIAILLIIGALLIVYTRVLPGPQIPSQVYNFQKTLLDEIAANETMRNYILQNNPGPAQDFVGARVPAGFESEVKICEPGDICPSTEYHEEIFSTERIISVTLEQEELEPKKIKVFMWRK